MAMEIQVHKYLSNVLKIWDKSESRWTKNNTNYITVFKKADMEEKNTCIYLSIAHINSKTVLLLADIASFKCKFGRMIILSKSYLRRYVVQSLIALVSNFLGTCQSFWFESCSSAYYRLFSIVVVKRSLRCDVKRIEVIREVLVHIFI